MDLAPPDMAWVQIPKASQRLGCSCAMKRSLHLNHVDCEGPLCLRNDRFTSRNATFTYMCYMHLHTSSNMSTHLHTIREVCLHRNTVPCVTFTHLHLFTSTGTLHAYVHVFTYTHVHSKMTTPTCICMHISNCWTLTYILFTQRKSFFSC